VIVTHKITDGATIFEGDVIEALGRFPAGSVQTCVTSPPYWGLRDYGVPGQLGLEPTPDEYVQNLVNVFRLVKRALRDDGTLWLNLGDSYAAGGGSGKQRLDELGARLGTGGGKKHSSMSSGRAPTPADLKPKDLVGIPWRVAFALQADGWYLRSDIIWHKPNPMPESVIDRPTKAHEYIFLMAKSPKYFYDAEAIKEPAVMGSDLGLLRGRSFADGKNVSAHSPSIQKRQAEGIDSRTAGSGFRNKRSVWTVTPKPYKGAHFATFPPALVEPCILAGAPIGGVVLDPFAGSGTTLAVAIQHGRRGVGIELNPEYVKLAAERISAANSTAKRDTEDAA